MAEQTAPMELHGRRIIYADDVTITADNVLDVWNNIQPAYLVNQTESNYLWNYYKGKQPILDRTKSIREEICNKLVENRANEIVSFYEGYVAGEPVQYTVRGQRNDAEADTVPEAISDLNEMMYADGKSYQDKDLIQWQLITGTSYRLVLPAKGEDDVPFHMYTLDPRFTAVVYSNGIDHRPLMAIIETQEQDGTSVYTAYTDRMFFEFIPGKIRKMQAHALGVVPVFEYPLNTARMGAFEIVIPILDAINLVESNRIDGVEQFVQSFVKFINCDISGEDWDALRAKGAIKVKSIDGAPADVDIITQELNQNQTQTLVDEMYQTVLTICGMPNRNGGTSTSDTGIATIYRDGWEAAESRAKAIEMMFKKSERPVLSLVLRICRDIPWVSPAVKELRIQDIGIQFTRRNYENIQSKSQVLTTMLNNNKIHPRLAFEHCGMFSDPEDAYQMSMRWYEDEMAKWEPVELDHEDDL